MAYSKDHHGKQEKMAEGPTIENVLHGSSGGSVQEKVDDRNVVAVGSDEKEPSQIDLKTLETNELEREMKQNIVDKYCSGIPNLLVYGLVIVFGLSSWVAVNGIYNEIPILGYSLPEGYAIAVDMNLSLQLANIVPLLYFVIMIFRNLYRVQKHPNFMASMDNRFEVIDTVAILTLIVIGICSLVTMAFVWNIPAGGQSYPFLVMTFFVGVCDCTSTLLYYPFVLHFKHAYTSALLVGESLTGLIASVLAIIQMPTSNQVLFPFWVYCILLAGITLLSGIAYGLLRFLPYCKKELRKEFDSLAEEKRRRVLRHMPFITPSTIRLIIFQFLISFTENGVIVSILPYVFSHYRNHNTLLHYAITFGMIISPIASGVAYAFPFYNFFVALFCHLLWMIGASFLTFIAFMNPNPPNKYSEGFGVFLVLVAIVTRAFISFTKTKEFLYSHQEIEKRDNAIYLKLAKQAKKELENQSATKEGSGEGKTTMESDNLQPINAEPVQSLDGQTPTSQKEDIWFKLKFVLDLNPFRLAGFGIQAGALLATIIIKVLSDAGYFA